MIIVPVLPPSTSWLFDDLYVYEDFVAPVTVNVMLVLLVERLLDTRQNPLEFVVQLVVPVAPPVHLIFTLTPESGVSLAL